MEEKDTSNLLLANRYQLQQRLGTGGMAQVYMARDLMLERPVAIKVLKKDFSANPSQRNRFRQEAKAAANLSHPNIVTVHDFGFHKGRLYIVMEYVPGKNLKEIMNQYGRFTVEEAIPLIIQACNGIGYAHRAGLVHCDIKPHNMLISPDQRLKVTDFGIARALSSIHPEEKFDVVWGSPQYFSPEQASGKAPSPASDVYSLGVIMYEMITGKLPFDSDDPVELARMHREEMPVPPRKINPSIPQSLEQILLKVLSKEPSARYRTTDQLGRILETYQAKQTNHEQTNSNNRQTKPVVAEEYFPPQPAQQYQTVINQAPPVYEIPYEPQYASDVEEESETQTGIDWASLGLGLLALIFVGGLVPFWLYVWLTLNTK